MLAEQWSLVAADLMSQYALNVYDQRQMRTFGWTAFRTMVGGLFAVECRVTNWYEQQHGKTGEAVSSHGAGHRRARGEAPD
jgi:hypothetical protein